MALLAEATESGAATYISNATPTTLYTNAQGAGKSVRISKCIVKNVTAGAVTLKIYKVPSGGVIAGTDWLVYEDSLAANDGVDVRDVAGMYLDNGDSLRALAGTVSALRFDLSLLKET